MTGIQIEIVDVNDLLTDTENTYNQEQPKPAVAHSSGSIQNKVFKIMRSLKLIC